jgi:predicted nucleic acid-binding protein
MTIYLDNCCLNRPFDDQRRVRVRMESEAVLLILDHVEQGVYRMVASLASILELEECADVVRRERVAVLLALADIQPAITPRLKRRAAQIEKLGFHAFDALHLAGAETAAADVFLTTDDRLLKTAIRMASRLRVTVKNPLTWVAELFE